MMSKRLLHESAALKGRVDRDQGIIFGVKVVGRSSPNTHGVTGVEGTDYTLDALNQSRAMYEGINVNVDHPDRRGPAKDRSSYDRFAWLESVQVQEGGSFGDLHFLDPKDPLAIKMMNAAERHPESYALSHNAYGRGDVVGKRYIVREIPEVKSVDIVADGGTNRSLFESNRMAKTIKTLILESAKMDPALKVKLLEMGKECGDAMDKPLKEGEGEGEPDWKDHVTNAIGTLVKSDDPAHHDTASKLMKHLRPADKEEGEEEEKPVEEGSDEIRGKNQDGQKRAMWAKDPDNPYEESLKRKTPAGCRELTERNQQRVRSLCKLAGVDATTELLESFAGLTSTSIATVLSQLKPKADAKPAPKGSPPRSTPAGSVRVTESRQGAASFGDAKSQAAALLKP